MDHSDHRQPSQYQNPPLAAPNQIPYPTPPYQAAPIPSTTTPPVTVSSPQHHPPFPNPHHVQHQQQQLQSFWANQIQEIEQTTDFKNHSLPLARIKKIMKADEDVKMISAEAPVVFAKACEMFILELTLRSWIHTEENKRRTLQKNDIAAAISRTDVFDFLVDIIPRDEMREEGLGVGKAVGPVVGSPNDGLPYYYVPPPVGPPVYGGGQQPRGSLPFAPWPQNMSGQGQGQGQGAGGQQQQSES